MFKYVLHVFNLFSIRYDSRSGDETKERHLLCLRFSKTRIWKTQAYTANNNEIPGDPKNHKMAGLASSGWWTEASGSNSAHNPCSSSLESRILQLCWLLHHRRFQRGWKALSLDGKSQFNINAVGTQHVEHKLKDF